MKAKERTITMNAITKLSKHVKPQTGKIIYIVNVYDRKGKNHDLSCVFSSLSQAIRYQNAIEFGA